MILSSPLFIFIYFGVALLLYHSTVYGLYDLWVLTDSGAYTHGVLLLGVSVYIFYRAWLSERETLSVRPNIIGLILLMAASSAWFLVELADIAVLEELLLVFIFLFIVWSLFGYEKTKKFSFPILLLVCAIPIWDVLNGLWLQKATAEIVTIILKLIGISTYREGAYIYVPAGNFQVAETCSGMRQLVAAISIGVIYSYINHFRIVALFSYTLLSAIISFFINSIRILIVVISGELTDMQHYFIREDHVTLGWVLFGVGMFLFVRVSNIFLAASSKAKSQVFNDSLSKDKYKVPERSEYQYLLVGLVFIALSTGPALAFLHSINKDEWRGALIIPSIFDEWQLKKNNGNYRPHFISGDVVYEAVYANSADESVYFYIGYFWNQEQGRELISTVNTVEDRGNWNRVSNVQTEVNISGKIIGVQETLLKSSAGHKKLVWNWYLLADGIQTSRIGVAKFFGIWGELIGEPGSASLIVATDVINDESNARLRLKNFLNKSLLKVERRISQAPDNVLK